ncbi:hypothetical protein IWW34DRAFT_92996 [Fusarium oxysporum f. sp. albedinis]|jgi:hypothetical protein|nr:hypothetical protein IWW34DRAFT_92996 [Fusarium oxysporum f. sp. albedinis]
MSLHVPGVRRQHPLWHVCRSSYELMCQASQMVVTRFHTCRYSRVILHWLKGKVNSLVHLTQTVSQRPEPFRRLEMHLSLYLRLSFGKWIQSREIFGDLCQTPQCAKNRNSIRLSTAFYGVSVVLSWQLGIYKNQYSLFLLTLYLFMFTKF